MTPQEINEYKLSWRPGYSVQVDMDSDVWGKDFCRRKLMRQEWSFNKHTRPDDSHTFSFAQEEFAEVFLIAYNQHNPKFSTGVE